jgi:peptidoglycan/xylan/chitin deacetylase (PgdA/CDA1 family)
VLASRRNQWILTVVIAAIVFGALAVVFTGGSGSGGGDDSARGDRSGGGDRSARRGGAAQSGERARPTTPRGGLGGSATQPLPPRPVPEGPQSGITEAEAIERLRRRMPWVTRGGEQGRLIALTFDDGPGPITPALLAELRRLRAPATFFPVGSDALSNPDIARGLVRPPFAIGSHTATHQRLSKLGRSAQFRQVFGGERSVQRITGVRPHLFRPPYGDYDDRTLRVLREDRSLMVLWTFSAYDWKHPDADYITRRVLRLARPGAIVLMHDGGGSTRVPTLQAVPRIVTGLRRRGYRLVTVPRLLRDAPPERRSARPRSPYPG